MEIRILKEKLNNGEIHYGYEITNHGFKGHPPTLSNWFATQEAFKKQLNHYIEQYIGRVSQNKRKKDN